MASSSFFFRTQQDNWFVLFWREKKIAGKCLRLSSYSFWKLQVLFFPPLSHYYIVNKTFEKIGKQHKDINISHDAQHISHENYSVPSFNLWIFLLKVIKVGIHTCAGVVSNWGRLSHHTAFSLILTEFSLKTSELMAELRLFPDNKKHIQGGNCLHTGT